MRKIIILLTIVLISMMIINAQPQTTGGSFNPDDFSTLSSDTSPSEFAKSTPEQINKADSEVIKNKVTSEQAKAYLENNYFSKNKPLTSLNQNELIIYQKVYPNVDTSSFQNVEGMELGKGYVKGPTGSVTFKDSNVPIKMENGNIIVQNIEIISGSITFNDPTHYTLGPNTQISTYGLAASVIYATEFYLQTGKCSEEQSCLEADSLLKNIRAISVKQNDIAISADNSVYENFDMRKDKFSSFLLVIDNTKEVKFDSDENSKPLAKGNLDEVIGKISVGLIGSETWIYDADSKEFKKCDNCESVGKVYGNGQGRLSKYRKFVAKDGTIHFLDLEKSIDEQFREILGELKNEEVPEDKDAAVKKIVGGVLIKEQGTGNTFIIPEGNLFDATNHRGIPIHLDTFQGPATLRVGGRDYLIDDLPVVVVDEKDQVQIKHGTLVLGENNPISKLKGPDGITVIAPDESPDKSRDYVKAKNSEVEINSVAGDRKSFYTELSPSEGNSGKGQIRIVADPKTNNLIKISNDATQGAKITIHTDANLNTPTESLPVFEIQNGRQLLRVFPDSAIVEEVSSPTTRLTKDPATYAPVKIQLELIDSFGNKVRYQIDPSVGYKRFDSIKSVKP